MSTGAIAIPLSKPSKPSQRERIAPTEGPAPPATIERLAEAMRESNQRPANRDDLTQIRGVTPERESALNALGIWTFRQLLDHSHDPDALAARLDMSTRIITRWNWFGQARELIQRMNDQDRRREKGTEATEKAAAPPEEKADTEKEPQDDWKIHTSFSLFFEQKTDEQGEQDWQTRVYFDQASDVAEEETPFAGLETRPWVNRILELANLPGVQTIAPAKLAESEPREKEEAGLEILDFQVFKPASPSDARRGRLQAKLRFRLADPPTERNAFQIQILAVPLEEGEPVLLAFERDSLEPGEMEYTGQLALSLPKLGRYALQCVVLTPPPGERAAFRQSPVTLDVRP
jgi:predicted flap endonuclease-1-like 5' DNA nuclease